MGRASRFLLVERRGNSERPLYTADSLEEMQDYINTKTGSRSSDPDQPDIGFGMDDLLISDDDDGGFF